MLLPLENALRCRDMMSVPINIFSITRLGQLAEREQFMLEDKQLAELL